MNVYVASTLDNWQRVRKLHAALKELGMELTYDWTAHNGGCPYVDDSKPELKSFIAELELAGVANAHALLVVMPGGCGTHVEMGYALALNKPVVLLLDQHHGKSPSFHFLTNKVVRCATEQEAFAALIRIKDAVC